VNYFSSDSFVLVNMNLLRLPLALAASACLAVAQPQSAVTIGPPPPGLEEALRERVRPFYQAYVDSKFRKAYDIVADDSKDAFLIATRPHYDGFAIQKIVFSDDFTKAVVTTEIHTTMYFYGQAAPEKTTEESHWEVLDGQWYWYVPAAHPGDTSYTPAQRALMGLFRMRPAENGPAPVPGAGTAPSVPAPLPSGMPPGLPPGMPTGFPPGFGFPQAQPPNSATVPSPPTPAATAALLQQLRNQVILDRNNVELRANRAGTAVVVAKNTMTAPVQVGVSCADLVGLTVASDKTLLGANESATITVTWKPAKSHVAPAPASCGVSVKPTSAFVPFTITFR
jgi:hypothetical protein